MNPDRIRIDIDEHGVADVAMTRAAKLNALDPEMFDALRAALDQLRGERRLRAVVLHGEGRAFCAGLDMTSFERIGSGPPTDPGMADLAARTHGLANAFQQVGWGWRELPVPVIAALHGTAFGGGLQIALGADIRLCTPDARLSVMEIRWGLIPDMAGCALLAPLLRGDVLRDLVFSGRIVDGTEAVGLGLATRVAADPLAEARALAHAIAAQSPDAIRAAKRLCNLATAGHAPEVLLAEAREQQALLGGANQAEAVRAGLSRSAPRFADAVR